MSGSSIAYHLRKNKAVDRNLFIEFLGIFNTQKNLKTYRYVSLGGPFLEDLKQIHSQLGLVDLVSLEEDESVIDRQRYNLPYSCIECKNMNSANYIDTNDFSDKPYIIWLDYADAKKRPHQLLEIESILKRLKPYDILKITMNANPETLFNKDFTYDQKSKKDVRITNDQKAVERLKKIQSTIKKEYLPSDLKSSDLETSNFPMTLSRIIHKVTNEALHTHNITAHPILSFNYNDASHQMYTLTLILLPKKSDSTESLKINQFIDLIKQWEVSTLEWGQSKEINLPDLTAKEKFFFDEKLPCQTAQQIADELPFKFSKKDKINLKQINSYKLFYRSISHFTKVVF